MEPKDLSKIQALGLWMEGKAGNFTLDVAWIAAGNASSLRSAGGAVRGSALNSTCSGPVQKNLRYNVGGRLASKYLPFPPSVPGETLAMAICCDNSLESFAEPPNFFALPGIDLFKHVSLDKPTTFYGWLGGG